MAKGNKCKVYISKLISLQVMVKFEGERGGDGEKSILRAIFLTSYYFPRILHLQ